MKRIAKIVLVTLVVAAGLAGSVRPALGATFVVNDTGNAADTNPANGICEIAPPGSGICTLRAAIEEANQLPGADTINFNIPGTDVNCGFIAGFPAVCRIQPDSPLPVIADSVTIDASTQPGVVDRPVIWLDGLNAGAGVDGLRISGSSVTVRGFIITRFGSVYTAGDPSVSNSGIEITGAGGNTIEGNCIGTRWDCDKIDESPSDPGVKYGNLGHGVFIMNSPNNTVGGTDNTTPGGACSGDCNVISGAGRGINLFNGVRIAGQSSTGNVVKGNFLGMDVTGTLKRGNAAEGVFISGAIDNIIGGTTPSARNLISGSPNDGIEVNGAAEIVCTGAIDDDGDGAVNDGCIKIGATAESGAQCANALNDDAPEDSVVNDGCPRLAATGNTVQGNFIGTKTAGDDDASNGFSGITLNAAASNCIGGAIISLVCTPVGGGGNLISGNLMGIQITNALATGNVVVGNFIGTDSSGALDVGNLADGISIVGAPANTIGSTSATGRNLISGNGSDGIDISQSSAAGNVVLGNYIGTDAAGTSAIGNGSILAGTGSGIRVNGVANTIVGGTSASSRNVVSGNAAYGIEAFGNLATGTVVQGNYIGTNVAGTGGLGNGKSGVYVDGARNSIIGGSGGGAKNVISANGAQFVTAGITIVQSGGAPADGNVVQGNYIGVDVNGSIDLGNSGAGILIAGAPGNTIGGTTSGAGNVISGNGSLLTGGHGIEIALSGATGNAVQGNYIGTNAAGTGAVGNGGNGLLITGANNCIGGAIISSVCTPVSGGRNVISGNVSMGVEILDTGATGNVVVGNYIGTAASGNADLGNTVHGVFINGAPNNIIGGTAALARNVISGNDDAGVLINSSGATGNAVRGNYIGTDANGTGDLGNLSDGIRIIGSASNNLIGGDTAGAANAIAFNDTNGVVVNSGTGNSILSNSISANSSLGIDLGLDGVSPNDDDDPDSGANNLQNYPALTSASSSVFGTTVVGSLSSAPNTTFKLQFFASVACDSSGFGEGSTFLGAFNVTTDGAGDAGFNQNAGSGGVGGQFITATATDPSGNTSEFSACVLAAVSTDADGDGRPDASDNCPFVPNFDQANFDGDSYGDACDLDDDGDMISDVTEQNCGSNPLNPAIFPERIDGAFAATDDDGDTLVDEGLPPGSEAFDCDGDGFKGSLEMVIYSAGGTVNDQDPCGNNGWPAELVGNDNTLNIGDFNSFIFPLRGDGTFNKFGHPVPDAVDPNIARWNLDTAGGAATIINIGDLNAMNPSVLASTARPPMLGGQPAFFTNGGLCPFPP